MFGFQGCYGEVFLAKLYVLARNQQITIFASEALLLELEATLKRDKFQIRLQERGYTVEYLMSVVKEFSNFCPTTSVDALQLRHSKDNKILAAAIVANAEAIVTGDLDLLVLIEFNYSAPSSPTEFGTPDQWRDIRREKSRGFPTKVERSEARKEILLEFAALILAGLITPPLSDESKTSNQEAVGAYA